MYKAVVVEDESIVRHGIMQSVDWESAGCMLMGDAENGAKGLELIKKVEPDIVITDISMPELNGLEMMEAVYNAGLSPKVIFLTAYDEFSYAQKAIKLRACDYILKPFEDGELEKCLERAVTEIGDKPVRSERNGETLELTLRKGDKSKYLADAIKYIDENYANPDISVENVADYLGISGGHLSRLFRKETDYTMMTYLMNRRMKEAKKLLKDYSHKVYEVAELVGYKDIAYFSATFKKYVGVSPSEYQDRYR